MAEGDQGRPYDPQKDAAAQEPLTPNEARLVTRLFSDPFAFPLEFKAWLRGWLEEQFPRIGSLASAAESGAAGAFVPPAGAILEFGGDVAPSGYVLCDGTEYDKTGLAYQRLFNAIGYKFSTVTSGNLFKVPDARERVSVMKGTLGYLDTLGKTDGLAVGSRGIIHRHSLVDGGFLLHTVGTAAGYAGGGGDGVPGGGVGPLGTPLDGPGYYVVNKIISLGS